MANILYALYNEQLKHIDDVANGLKCNCTCASCGEKLIARNAGKIKIHHFAHISGANCAGGYQTSLHLLAKDILSKESSIFLPQHKVLNFEITQPQVYQYTKVVLEKKLGNIVPDVVITTLSGEEIMIEIKVTHGIDDDKLKKIKRLDTSTIEIDVSNLEYDITEEYLKPILIDDSDVKKWIYHKKGNQIYNKLVNNSEEMEIISRGLALHVDFCPIEARVYHGKPYANFIDDCIGCEYFLDDDTEHNEDEDYQRKMRCFGKLGVKTLEDIENLVDVIKVEGIIKQVNLKNKTLGFSREVINDCKTLNELWIENDEEAFLAINPATGYSVSVLMSPKEIIDAVGYFSSTLYKNGKSLGVREIFGASDPLWKILTKY